MSLIGVVSAGGLPVVRPPERSCARGHVVLLLASGNPTFSGGVPGQVLSRARYLSEHGYEVSIIARGNPEWSGLQTIEGIRVFAIRPKDFKLGKWLAKQWFHPLLGPSIEAFLPTLHSVIPIEHLLIFDSQAGVPAIKFAEQNGITTQFSIHGSALLPYDLPKLLKRLSPKWEAYCYQRASLVAPIGHAIADHFGAHFHTTRPIKVLRNALNPLFFNGEKSSTSSGYFLFAGRLELDKRPLAMVTASSTGSLNPEIRIKIVGEGSMRAELEAKVKGLANVDLPVRGAKNAQEMREAYRGAKCFVWTSIAEAMAVAPLEAMAMGVPVIAPTIPSAIELLGKNYPGLVEIDDIEGLSRMMNRVDQDENFRQLLIGLGNDACEPYRSEVAYSELEEALDEQIAFTRRNRITVS